MAVITEFKIHDDYIEGKECEMCKALGRKRARANIELVFHEDTGTIYSCAFHFAVFIAMRAGIIDMSKILKKERSATFFDEPILIGHSDIDGEPS